MDIGCNSTNVTELVVVATSTEIVTTPTTIMTTSTEIVTTVTPVPAGGGTKILHLDCLALYAAFTAIALMK